MASSGYLVSPTQEPGKEKLWTETWKRIDRFLPDLRSDLASEEPEEPEKPVEPKEPEEKPVKEEAEAEELPSKEAAAAEASA